MENLKYRAGEDPFHLGTRLLRRLKTSWLRRTYPFYAIGAGVSIDFSCDIPRPMSPDISIGNDVYLAPDVWLTVIPGGQKDIRPRLVLGDRCSIGKRTSISAHNQIIVEPSVLMGPSVVIMDYNHEFSDPELPIRDQGVNAGGRVLIEKNCWIGQGAAILCGRGELILGRNSVVGANAVVTRSCPPFSVLAGNPAKIVRTFDPDSGVWKRTVDEAPASLTR